MSLSLIYSFFIVKFYSQIWWMIKKMVHSQIADQSIGVRLCSFKY